MNDEDKAPFVARVHGEPWYIYAPFPDHIIFLSVREGSLDELIDANPCWLKRLKKISKRRWQQQKDRLAKIEQTRQETQEIQKLKVYNRSLAMYANNLSTKDLLKIISLRMIGKKWEKK